MLPIRPFVRVGALVCTGTLVFQLIIAAPAGAAALPSANGVCNVGDFCAWRDDNMGAGIADTPNAVSNYNGYQYWLSAQPLNDQNSSVWNWFTNYTVRMYEHNTYGGWNDCYPRQMTRYVNISSRTEDKGSSHKGVTGKC